jgi:hypothetical protein
MLCTAQCTVQYAEQHNYQDPSFKVIIKVTTKDKNFQAVHNGMVHKHNFFVGKYVKLKQCYHKWGKEKGRYYE